jgi:hypothetical protein
MGELVLIFEYDGQTCKSFVPFDESLFAINLWGKEQNFLFGFRWMIIVSLNYDDQTQHSGFLSSATKFLYLVKWKG